MKTFFRYINRYWSNALIICFMLVITVLSGCRKQDTNSGSSGGNTLDQLVI